MAELLSIICFICAAICSAIMDKTETKISFNDSVFFKMKALYWSKVDSANSNAFIPSTKRRRDAWHDAKSGMIIFFALGAVTICHFSIFQNNNFNIILNKFFDLIIYAAAWNIPFNLFYNRIFKKK